MQDKIFVLNPLTREIREVPWAFPGKRAVMYGFGYDSLNNDYKIVAHSSHPSHMGDVCLFVNVYSLKNGCWKRRVKRFPDGHVVGYGFSGVFVNGCVNWLATNRTNYTMSIVAFDLAGETFNVVPLPISANGDNFGDGHPGVLGGCLCVFGDRGDDIWMMKEYGVHESWIKFKIDFLDSMCFVKLLCMFGEEVVMRNDAELVIYNLAQGTLKGVVVNAVEDCNHHVTEMNKHLVAEISYVESLVSPHATNETE